MNFFDFKFKTAKLALNILGLFEFSGANFKKLTPVDSNRYIVMPKRMFFLSTLKTKRRCLSNHLIGTR